MALRVDIRDSGPLQDLVRALKGADRTVAVAIRKASRDSIKPMWAEATRGRAQTVFETRLANTARVAVSDQNVTLAAAKVRGTKFSNGLDIRESWAAIDRGGSPTKKTTYQRTSSKGRVHSVTRRTMTQFRPRNREGYILSPARAEIGPRVLSLWVQTAIRTLYDNLEGKSR